jgi:hypothetical protein
MMNDVSDRNALSRDDLTKVSIEGIGDYAVRFLEIPLFHDLIIRGAASLDSRRTSKLTSDHRSVGGQCVQHS